MVTRRQFMQSTSAGLFLAGWPTLETYGATKELGNIVVIMLEGGLDGLTAVPPIGDPDLVKHRENLIPSNPIKLTSLFSLHPNLRSFAGMLKDGNGAIVHATSIPYVGRSHFEGQNLMQSGGTAPFADKTGWLGRAMEQAGVPGRALSLGMPLLIRGEGEVTTHYPANIRGTGQPSRTLIEELKMDHEGELASAFQKLIEKNMEAMGSGGSAKRRDSASLARYAGQQLKKPDGPHVAAITISGFDTHASQGTDSGRHPELLAELDMVFRSFKQGLGSAWNKTIILTMTEFGRTVEENGSRGTDHGYGTCALLAGGLLTKPRVLSKWPGLKKSDLFERRDLESTLDYRSICASCIGAAFGLDHDVITERVFNEKSLLDLSPLLFS
tara:strand:+ start:79 stop:1230 length:1152 start_codon:yes stop_codon:yes gene_type:complete